MDIYSLSLEELTEILVDKDLERYRGDQVFDWLYKKQVRTFDDMTNLPKQARKELSVSFSMSPMKELAREVSEDGTEKSLYMLEDGHLIESVIIRHPDRTTLCISTQVGCPMKCPFCATGQSGYVRDLTIGEIVFQAVELERSMEPTVGTNIVFMGMGEPLLNLENVLKAISILNSPKGRAMGVRRFTISTLGIPDGIRAIAERAPAVKLSISLHSPNDTMRSKLVPLNKTYGLKELFAALEDYVERTGNRLTFEYVLMDGMNDSVKDARDLSELIAGLPAYVNIIPLNPTQSLIRRPSDEKVVEFCEELHERGVEAFVRIEKGKDIEAACGQLRLRYLEGGEFDKKNR